MNNLIVKYHNVDIEKIAYLLKKEIEIVDNIQNETYMIFQVIHIEWKKAGSF